MRTAMVLIFGIFTFLTPPSGSAQAPGSSSDALPALIREALDHNPRIEAALRRSEAADAAIRPAGALPDPQVTLGLMNLPVNSFAFDQEPMTGKVIGLMQMIPTSGKLGLAARQARSDAAAAKSEEREIRNETIRAVRRAYYDIFAVDRARDAAENNRRLLEQLVGAAEDKYAAGSGLQQDVLRAQVELSRIEDSLLQWDQKRLILQARLNALLARPAGREFPRTPSGLKLPDSGPPATRIEKLPEIHPLLIAWADRLEKAGLAVRLARADLWPNLTVGISYSQRNDLRTGAVMHDFFSTTLSLSVPVFAKRKQEAKIAERELDRSALEAGFRDAVNAVVAELESARAALEQSRKRAELFENGVLRQARQSLASARAGYEAGKVDFLTMVANATSVESYEQQYFAAVADYFKAWADYDLASGSGEDSIRF